MMTAQGNTREAICLYAAFTVFYMTLFQVQSVVCQEPRFLVRALRSIASPHYEMAGTFTLHTPVYSLKVPFLGELSEPLTVGKVFRIRGFVPDSLSQFQINLCEDCSEGPIHLHIGVRFEQNVVVRNSYENSMWQTEERNGPVGFTQGREFVIIIEVDTGGYSISIDGQPTWYFAHRVPLTSVAELEMKGGSVLVWKIEYTDEATLKTEKSQSHYYDVNGEDAKGLTVHLTGRNSGIIEKFVMDLRCECTPQNSTVRSSESEYKKR